MPWSFAVGRRRVLEERMSDDPASEPSSDTGDCGSGSFSVEILLVTIISLLLADRLGWTSCRTPREEERGREKRKSPPRYKSPSTVSLMLGKTFIQSHNANSLRSRE